MIKGKQEDYFRYMRFICKYMSYGISLVY